MLKKIFELLMVIAFLILPATGCTDSSSGTTNKDYNEADNNDDYDYDNDYDDYSDNNDDDFDYDDDYDYRYDDTYNAYKHGDIEAEHDVNGDNIPDPYEGEDAADYIKRVDPDLYSDIEDRYNSLQN